MFGSGASNGSVLDPQSWTMVKYTSRPFEAPAWIATGSLPFQGNRVVHAAELSHIAGTGRTSGEATSDVESSPAADQKMAQGGRAAVALGSESSGVARNPISRPSTSN